MAATYDPTLPSPKDRVRRYLRDKAAPFAFQDEEIVAVLDDHGIPDGDNAAPAQQTQEIETAIDLLETEGGGSGNETTIRQGSVARTYKSGAGDRSLILANLRRRLASVVGSTSPNGGIIAVEQYDPRDSNDLCPTFCGFPIALP